MLSGLGKVALLKNHWFYKVSGGRNLCGRARARAGARERERSQLKIHLNIGSEKPFGFIRFLGPWMGEVFGPLSLRDQ